MDITSLQQMLENGQDSLILRFGLGQALLKKDEPLEAIKHLRKALEYDHEHSATWKLLARALSQSNQKELAIETYKKGISIADKKGDIQAVKEMKVFLKRLLK